LTSNHNVLLVTGGGRSGKSRYALERASGYGRKGFVATAEAFDDEMRLRIAKHQAERGDDFRTVESPVALADGIRSLAGEADVVVVDCLTVWLGNLMHKQEPLVGGLPEGLVHLLALLADPPMDVILVTNEVGLGIIPGDALSREYRDLAGIMNQRVAAVAGEVVLVVCGLPLVLKQGGA
jgi:adenosylcobinamide kinase/adenosylcobinamide-phosphate guanylyltransferase